MKRILSLVLSLVTVLSVCTALPFTALAKGDIPNVSLSSDNVLTWDAYDGATRYWLTFGLGAVSGAVEPSAVERTADLNELARSHGFASGTYNYALVACDDSWNNLSNYAEGSFTYEAVNKLTTPANPRWDGLVAKWDAVENADYYNVKICDADTYATVKVVTVSENENDLSDDIALLKDREYVFCVSALAESTYGASDYSAYSDTVAGWFDKNYIRHLTVTEDGVMTWDAYPGTVKYWIRVGGGLGAFESTEPTVNLFERAAAYGDSGLACTELSVTVVACDRNWNDLSYETPVTYQLHYWDDGVITTPATYDSEGEITYTCTKCGETRTEPLEKLPSRNGWLKEDGKWYYYTDNVAATGWQKVGGKWYYFNASGAMVTGWQKVGGKWYYFNASGAMVTGWQKLSGKWYYFNASGAMVTGWQKLSGKWYYFNSSGAMVTGWQKISGKWYYFNSGGDMKTGWLKSGGSWYYLDTSGAMLANTSKKIGSKTYQFNSSGVCTNP